MTKASGGRGFASVPKRSHSTARRPARLGSYMYVPGQPATGPAKGVLVKGGLPVALEVTEEILQEFVDVMNSLEDDVAQRWPGQETWLCGSPTG
ncbi:hypothetical protein EDD94_0454 [Streptomyces sp. PanSC9]|jgi:hypothetical protein|nr:hypothetical protein EDD94_0454 [Streptomyces sp. PanSC9]